WTKRSTHEASYEFGEAFASGVFLGVAFLHLLPHASDIFATLLPSIHYPFAEAICVMSFLFFIFLERLSLVNTAFKPTHNIPYIMSLILIIHALLEGATLGIEKQIAEASLIFIAIIAHKGSASFALCI